MDKEQELEKLREERNEYARKVGVEADRDTRIFLQSITHMEDLQRTTC